MAGKRKRDTLPPAPPRREESAVFADLAALCARPGFCHAIAFFCYRDNLVRFEKDLTPDDLAYLHTGAQLCRTEISTLLGLMVRAPIDVTIPEPATTDELIADAEKLLHELHQALGMVWLKGLTPEAVSVDGFNPFSSGKALREPIFYGGDAAYSFQYRDFAVEKYAADRDWLRTNKGFDLAAAIAVATELGKLQVEKQTALPKDLRIRPPGEWSTLPAFRFSLSELIPRVPIEADTTKRVIQAFCLPESDFNQQFVSLQDYNSTNAMPIIRLGEDDFVLFQHYSLLEAIYEAPFFWMGADPAYSPTALANRGKYTETIALDVLKRVFGDNAHANIHIEKSKGVELGEIDVLVVFGDRAIVLQAKSKRLTLAARKGNDLQIKDDFKKAVQASYDQALLCSKAIVEENHKLTKADGTELVLPMPIRQVFPVCVVADHYPALGFQARQFLKSEVSIEILPPLVTDVFALDAITEMLETPLRVLSYLDLRATHGQKALSMQELTLLSVHLRYNLWVNEKHDLILYDEDISVHLDAAMAVRRAGLPGSRTPDGVLTRVRDTHVGRILTDIEARPHPATIALGFLLLTVGEDGIDDINRGIAVSIDAAAKDGRSHDFTASFGASSTGLTFHCNSRPRAEAQAMLAYHCSLRKYSQKAQSWFGLCLTPLAGDVRFGLMLEGEWEFDSDMDQAVQRMPSGIPPSEIQDALSRPSKVGRNAPCPCGSGRKFKKCHGA